MKVTNPNLTYLKNQQIGQTEAEHARKNGADKSGSEGIDRVAISELGRLIVQTLHETDKKEEVDEARIEQIRTMIESGEYQVDAQKLADSILRNHLR